MQMDPSTALQRFLLRGLHETLSGVLQANGMTLRAHRSLIMALSHDHLCRLTGTWKSMMLAAGPCAMEFIPDLSSLRASLR